MPVRTTPVTGAKKKKIAAAAEVKTDVVIPIHFPEGLVGFSDCKSFALESNDDGQGVFFWLRSEGEPDLSFPLVDPAVFAPDYHIQLSVHDLKAIELTDESDAVVLLVATIQTGQEKRMYLNLRAPIIVNRKKKIGKQAVLDGEEFPLKFPVDF